MFKRVHNFHNCVFKKLIFILSEKRGLCILIESYSIRKKENKIEKIFARERHEPICNLQVSTAKKISILHEIEKESIKLSWLSSKLTMYTWKQIIALATMT